MFPISLAPSLLKLTFFMITSFDVVDATFVFSVFKLLGERLNNSVATVMVMNIYFISDLFYLT